MPLVWASKTSSAEERDYFFLGILGMADFFVGPIRLRNHSLLDIRQESLELRNRVAVLPPPDWLSLSRSSSFSFETDQ